MILKENTQEKITCATDVFNMIKAVQAAQSAVDQDKEHFWAIGLNAKNKIKYLDLVFMGALDQCLAEPRELYRLAVMKACKSLIVVHNHTSGNPEPSSQDREATVRIKKAGEILGILLLDHVIVGDETFFSFAEAGRL